MRSPISSTPTTGYNKTGAIFSIASGSFSNALRSIRMIKPAAKPATSAPKNPDFPLYAIIPPTNPSSSAGRSPIAIPIKPASTGSINPNAVPPIPLSSAATGVIVPKSPLWSAGSAARSTFRPSIKNARAIRIPPPTTNGSICETPFISHV